LIGLYILSLQKRRRKRNIWIRDVV